MVNAFPRHASLPTPDPQARARSLSLQKHICAQIDANQGFIAFDRYMQLALYTPGLGYYDGANVKFGAEGDFVTAPEISPLFARCLAQQIRQTQDQLPAAVLEFGAGSGALARELIPELLSLGYPLKQYFILDVSNDLRHRQQETLAGLPVTWLDHLPEAFSGVVVANEVLDAMPVRLFVSDETQIIERGVTHQNGQLQLSGRAAPSDLVQAVHDIASQAGPWPAGYGSEWGPQAQAWIRSLAAALGPTLVLLIDYGFPRREYYHAQRAMGTVMCHYRQHAHADPLWWPGLNDITAHVDFSACAQAALGSGFQIAGYTSQAHFLLNCGILQYLADSPQPAVLAGAQKLILESEMGELFKVLALSKDVELEPLKGFLRGDRCHRL